MSNNLIILPILITVFVIIFIHLVAAIIVLIVLLRKQRKRKISPQPLAEDNSLKELETKRLNLEDVIKHLERSIQDKEIQYTSWNDRLTELNNQADSLIKANKEKTEELQKVNEEKEKVLLELKKIEEGIAASKTALQDLSQEQRSIQGDLETLKNIKKVVLMDGENQLKDTLWDLSINEHEKKLISILNQIKLDYPELKMDISTIEWKRIWLPKLQDLGNREDLGCKGIYRLVLKENEKVCYVGQAVSIQNRWYQHVKKMIGVEPAGNEKLYNYRPEDFYWSVLERGNNVKLDESEHYWIDYYCCKEVGLNKKA